MAVGLRNSFTPEIGVALVVASILGFTIDRWMKGELRRDVFLASIGHILAPEFRAEVSRIVGYSLICERHLLLIKIESIGSGLVRITSHVERTIRNRSAYPQSIRNITHMDEWGYQKAGTSRGYRMYSGNRWRNDWRGRTQKGCILGVSSNDGKNCKARSGREVAIEVHRV